MRKPVATAFAVVFFLFALLVFAGAVFCAATLHVPKYKEAAHKNVIDVEIQARDGVPLHAWWIKATKPNGNCVAVLHGIADSRESSAAFAPMFLARGYNVLAPDSRAHGASGGELVTYGLLEKYDVLDWAQWMKAQGCGKLYALGESLGASILIQTAGLEPVFSAIAAECPYASLREIGVYRVQQLLPVPKLFAKPLATFAVASGMLYARLFYRLDFNEVEPVESIAHAATPILLIHGLADERTPPSHSRALAAANPKNASWFVPKARHTGASVVEPEEFRNRVLGWFAEH